MTIPFNTDVDDVCTHEQLGSEIGGTAQLNKLLRTSSDSEDARTLALRDVLKSLGRRTPAIRESDLLDVAELREAVMYGALAKLYRDAMTSEGDVYGVKMKFFEKKFFDEVRNVKPTVSTGAVTGVRSIRVSRR